MRHLSAAILATVLCLPAFVFGQGAYPNRAVRFIVPFLPGPAPDLVGRTVADELSKRLGQPFVVENRAGAGGTIGAEFVAKSPADGYTVFVGTEGPLGIGPIIYPKLGFDVLKDFAPISIVARSGFYVVVCPTLPVRTASDLIELSRRKPLSYASSGNGSFHHLTAEVMKKRGGFQMTHVPYKGASAAVADVMACVVDIGFVAVGSVLPQIQAGQMIPLVLTGKKPFAQLPNVPTFAAIGLPEVDPESFRFIVAPADIPPAVNKRLTDVLTKVMGTPEFRTRLVDNGFDPEFQKGNDARAFVSREITKWRKAVKDSGAKAN